MIIHYPVRELSGPRPLRRVTLYDEYDMIYPYGQSLSVTHHYTIKQMTVVALYLFAHGPVFDF